MESDETQSTSAMTQGRPEGGTLSVLVYPSGQARRLDGLLDSLRRLEGEALEVLLSPGVGEPDQAFAPFVKRVALPVRPEDIAGDWLLELREDWRPAEPDWLTRTLRAMNRKPEAIAGRGAVRSASWFLASPKNPAAPPYAHYLLWRAAAFKEVAAAREPLTAPPAAQAVLADLDDLPLAWRGEDAQPLEGPQSEPGLRGLLRRTRRRLAQTPVKEWPALLRRELRPISPTKAAKAAALPETPRTSQSAPSPVAAFLAFPRKVVPAAERFAILSQGLPPSPDSGGIGRYTNELAERLVGLGAEMHLITSGQGAPTLETMGLYRHPVALPCRPRRFEALPIAERNAQLAVAAYQRVQELELGGLRLDAIEAPNWDAEGFVLALAPAPPLVVRVHTPRAVTMRIEGWPETPDQTRNIAFERESILHADSLSASTAGITQTIGRIMGPSLCATLHFNHIPLGVNVGPAPAPNAPHEDLRILFVGRFEARKGIRALLEALPAVLQRCPRAVADLVGDDNVPDAAGRPWKEGFLARHANEPWLTRCRFHGKVSEERLASFYRECDFFVAPSLYESFGLVYLEAMREGKAVIGCSVGGVPEVIANNVNGLLVPPDDGAQLANAMIRLLENHAEREAMGRAGRRRVEEQFDVQQTALKTLALYRRVARDRRFEVRGRRLLPDRDQGRVTGGALDYDTTGSPAWLFDSSRPLRIAAETGWTRLCFRSGPDGGRVRIRPPQGRTRLLDLRAAHSGRRVAFFELREPLQRPEFEIEAQGDQAARLLTVLTTPAIEWPGQLTWKEAEEW